MPLSRLPQKSLEYCKSKKVANTQKTRSQKVPLFTRFYLIISVVVNIFSFFLVHAEEGSTMHIYVIFQHLSPAGLGAMLAKI